MTKDGPLYCSFCGKSQHEVFRLIAGQAYVFICDECVDLCAAIVAEERRQAKSNAAIETKETSDG